MYDPQDYPNPMVSDFTRQTRQVNHVSLKLPPSPLLSQPDDVPHAEFCEASDVLEANLAGSKCLEEFCSCIQRIKIQLGQVSEFDEILKMR